jgi:hypothetical protein
MSITSLFRRQVLASAIALAAFAMPFVATAEEKPQTETIQPRSAEARLHDSNGRQTDLQIARSRPDNRDVAARVRDECATWSPQQWDKYARSMHGM